MDTLENQLMEAIRSAKLEVVQMLIEKGVNINYIPSCGKSPLSTAAALGNVGLIKLLLKAGKSDNCTAHGEHDSNKSAERKWIHDIDNDKNQNDCLAYSNNRAPRERKQNLGYYIFVHSDEPGSQGLCEDVNRNESLDAETPEGMDGLEWDVEVEGEVGQESDDVWSSQYRWYADILDKTGGLVEDRVQGCDNNLQDYTGRCAVHYAVEYSQVQALQCLISAGCRVDVGDADNLTPLHLAAMRDHQDIAELLIKNGANVNRKTTDKMAPLHYAAVRGFVEMVDVLVRGGATVDPLDANDRTPLMLAVNRDHLDVVEALIRYGARLNIEEIHGYTPLCEAVFNKSVPVASLLLKSGAKLTQSQHLLHYAMLHRHLAMAELLLRHGAYPNLRDDHGDTPLILAISCSHLDMVKLLLQYEANPNYANSISGETPLHHAVCVGWHDLFDEILELLCLHNVDLNASSGGSSATTPLTTALIKWELNCAVSLIRAGADVNLCFAKNDWPLMHTNLTLALTRQADSLVYLIVAAGCDMSRYSVDYPQDFSEVDPDTLRGWLIYVKFNPPRLTDLCRLNLRSQMGNKALRLIPSLEIPRSLKEFLFYKDIYVKKYCALTDNKNTLMNYVFSLPLGQQ